MKNSTLYQIWTNYRLVDIVEAFLMGLIYYLLFAGIIVAPIITMSFLFVPHILYVLLAIYISLSFIGYYAITKGTETLQLIQPTSISFESYHKRASILLAILTFVILTIVYFVYLQ